MNMFAKFDEIPAMTLQDVKEIKCYGGTNGQTDGQRENSIPTTNKVCGGYNKCTCWLSKTQILQNWWHFGANM